VYIAEGTANVNRILESRQFEGEEYGKMTLK
jgi:hypothetical protein